MTENREFHAVATPLIGGLAEYLGHVRLRECHAAAKVQQQHADLAVISNNGNWDGNDMGHLEIGRRAVLAGVGSLAAPAIARGQSTHTLRFVPRTGLALLDPVWTTETATRAFALSVFESLYSVDEKLVPHPQMAEGHTVEDGGKRWVIRLRDGLRFHDGEPVLARDCVVSIGRWMKRDAVGRTLALRLDAFRS